MLKNPFRGSVKGDAWGAETDADDVTSIHSRTFEKCCEAVEAVREGLSSAGVVIHGEPGSGKTHLIGRLRRRFTDRFSEPALDRISQTFAYVRLNTDASTLARHVRRCVASDLLRSFGKSPSQIERLIITQLMRVSDGGGHIAAWWDHFLDEHGDDIDELLIDLAAKERLSPDFVKILGHIVRRQHRLEVAGWLRGDALSEASLAKLEVAEALEEDPEQSARQTLIDLMRLAGPAIPLVICFDQVEALQVVPEDTLPFFAYAKLIADLHDADTNLVLISCMQTGIAERIMPSIPEYAKARMEGYAICTLPPLRRDQAKELLAMRLCKSVSQERPNSFVDLSPLSEKDLTSFLGEMNHIYPRALLDKAAKRFDELSGQVQPTLDLNKWLDQEWDRRTEESLATCNPEISDNVMIHSIPMLVNMIEKEWTLVKDKRGAAVDHILEGPAGEARVGVKVLGDDNTRRTWGPLKTLDSQFPDKLRPRLEKLVILRDERSPVTKSAVKTRQFLDSLEKKNAHYVHVSPEAIAALNALRELLGDSQSGDLDFDGQTISPKTVREWLRQHLPGSLKELSDVLMTPGAMDIGSSLIDRLQEVLLDRFVVDANQIAGELSIAMPELIEVANSRPDLFGVVDGASTAVFSARLGNSCLTTSSLGVN